MKAEKTVAQKSYRKMKRGEFLNEKKRKISSGGTIFPVANANIKSDATAKVKSTEAKRKSNSILFRILKVI